MTRDQIQEVADYWYDVMSDPDTDPDYASRAYDYHLEAVADLERHDQQRGREGDERGEDA